MKKKTYRQWHKWLGIALAFFLLCMAVSGIVLDHRHLYGNVNVSRNLLPDSYRFRNWNNGLLRGTLNIGGDSIFVYGAGCVFLTDKEGKNYRDFTQGMDDGADARGIRNVVRTSGGAVFAVGQFDAYTLHDNVWQRMSVGNKKTRLSDATTKGDTVVFVSRDSLFVAVPPYKDFHGKQLKAPDGYTGDVSLFRTIWMMHNGQIIGIPGRVVVELIGVLLIFFCLSGICIWLLPKFIRRVKEKKVYQRLFKWNVQWHDRMGRNTILILLFITLTGFALRPPLLIALAQIETPAIPGTTLDSDNPWADRLRALRWDDTNNDWLLSTSDGFYSFGYLDAEPKREAAAPAVSVMGINVLQRAKAGNEWIVGSFAGLYRWNRDTDTSTDYFSGTPAPVKAGSPFGKVAVSGFSSDFTKDIVCTYYEGTTMLPQPEWMSGLPMSVWQLALEVHTGRIFTVLGPVTLLYVFIIGMLTFVILWSGWKIRKH